MGHCSSKQRHLLQGLVQYRTQWHVVTRAVFCKELYKNPKALRMIHQFTHSTQVYHLSSSHGSRLLSCFSDKLFGKQSLCV